MPLTLTWTSATNLPVEGDSLNVETLRNRSLHEIERLPIHVGNSTVEIGELFRVSGEPGGDHLVIEGDLTHVRGLGRGMTSGTLTVAGDAGDHLGAEMSGGSIEVLGSVGDWAGAALRGGQLAIRGSAGNHLGAAYPGARIGMREGVIVVEGPVGDDAGRSMRRGTIAVFGSAGDGLGHAMVAGSILAFGPVGRRPGVGMKRGTLALFSELRPTLFPTFRFACRYRPPVVSLYLHHLQALGFPVPRATLAGAFERYNGDLLDGGKGEVLIWDGG